MDADTFFALYWCLCVSTFFILYYSKSHAKALSLEHPNIYYIGPEDKFRCITDKMNLPLHLCKPQYGMEEVYKHKFIKFELVLMYSLYAIFRFARIATVSYFICYTETLLTKIEIHCARQGEPTDFSWTALFYKLHNEVFPKAVHSPGIPVLYQLYMAANWPRRPWCRVKGQSINQSINFIYPRIYSVALKC